MFWLLTFKFMRTLVFLLLMRLYWLCWLYMYRRAGTKTQPDRGIFVKHFKNIPMADMEIVLVRYIAVSSSFYLHPWLLSVTWTRTYFIAREEKPDANTDGLGQVSHFCCYRFGMFLMFWLSQCAATVTFYCTISLLLAGYSSWFSWNAKGWCMGCHSNLVWCDWVLC